MKPFAVLAAFSLIVTSFAADRAVKKSTIVDAAVPEVWKTLTTREGIATFLSESSNIDLRPGGRYEILFGKNNPKGLQGAEGCQVLSYIPEKMLSFSWNSPPTLPVMRLRKTFVVIELFPVNGGKTRVDLTNGGYQEGPEWDAAYQYFDNAWEYVLNSLADRFKNGPRKWPEPQPLTAEDKAKMLTGEKVLAEMAKFVGGKWEAELNGPEGKMAVEFTYKWHPDKKGIIGAGIIGKGSKDPVYINNSFGIDPITGWVYYLDSHNSGTVYFGYVTMEGEDLVFVFGPAGGKSDTFSSRGRFRGRDSYDNKIRQADGKEIVGFTLKRKK
jgi:uncharacterized protein YndB with AHSA1/START domain